MICKKQGILNHVLKNVGDKVVDSNVFFRGIFLSFEYFKVVHKVEEMFDIDVLKKEVELWGVVGRYDVEWFEKLLTCVEADNLTQDSICCVNTALIILIFAE